MWCTALASALLGAGVGLVTSEPNVRRPIPPAFKQLSSQAITCQVRPDVPFVIPEPCQAGESRRGECGYRSFISLSEDPASCSLVSFGTVDPSLRIAPYCNETQMSACADAVYSHRKRPHDAGVAHVKPIAQILVVPVLDASALDASLESGRPGHAAVAAPVPRCTDLDLHRVGSADEADAASPHERPQTAASTWSAETAAALYANTLRQMDLVMYGPTKARIAADADRTPESTLARPAAQPKRQAGDHKPCGTGRKQLAGMAAGLATVLIIFVVWL